MLLNLGLSTDLYRMPPKIRVSDTEPTDTSYRRWWRSVFSTESIRAVVFLGGRDGRGYSPSPGLI